MFEELLDGVEAEEKEEKGKKEEKPTEVPLGEKEKELQEKIKKLQEELKAAKSKGEQENLAVQELQERIKKQEKVLDKLLSEQDTTPSEGPSSEQAEAESQSSHEQSLKRPRGSSSTT
jgi:hypothetical protein